jgi:predicted lipoprotein with Yx(FWY)xxD motif
MNWTSIVAAIGLLGIAACTSDMGEPAHGMADTSAGKVLTTDKGMTLYTFDRDAPGKSNCNGACANAWPPLMAKADAQPVGKWSVVTRDDGGKQWAYDNKPLYGWQRDTKPGDATGEGFNNVWRVARP